ncbi:hypothetical protein L226DRAFT_208377 [Lentinus tigrinus ALCF2SS1-7]|uniref:Uncharacterized protein n=1 Tax=Lentinus tigrinus ALCF2SS1-6 TaxID=1328759 RepID=A0A5C2RVX3_9APHY|nr:hypothetical protein L227DRAFT_310169 [Lentinus tigrinus ALCF2SS1-6]RPD71376.1 hypothetical protein L226DRAFT_208377 [Lentinus tigrinus ALCF2SS1-7]
MLFCYFTFAYTFFVLCLCVLFVFFRWIHTYKGFIARAPSFVSWVFARRGSYMHMCSTILFFFYIAPLSEGLFLPHACALRSCLSVASSLFYRLVSLAFAFVLSGSCFPSRVPTRLFARLSLSLSWL